jgi:hypothetical protein
MLRCSSQLKSIELVAGRLSSLDTLVVFTGGAIVGLLLPLLILHRHSALLHFSNHRGPSFLVPLLFSF